MIDTPSSPGEIHGILDIDNWEKWEGLCVYLHVSENRPFAFPCVTNTDLPCLMGSVTHPSRQCVLWAGFIYNNKRAKNRERSNKTRDILKHVVTTNDASL